MSELIVIEQTNAVAVLSTDDGINALLSNVRANIDSMDGGSMKNKSSRKKIRSNAYQATIAFKQINDETIEPLIADLTKKIQPQLNVINAVKANQSVLQSGLQQIRKDVNADVDAFEADLQKIEDEKELVKYLALWDLAIKEDVLFNQHKKLTDHMQAIVDDAEFDRVKLEKIEAQRIREQKIAEDAAAEATLKAQQAAQAEKQRLIDVAEQLKVDAENQRKAAIQAERDKEIAEQERVEAIEKAKQDAIDATALFEKQQADNEANRIWQEKENKRITDEAWNLSEANRLAAIEQTKIDEAKKISDKKLADDQALATRKANQEHMTKIKTGIKLSLMEHANLSEADAIATVKALWAGKIAGTSVKI